VVVVDMIMDVVMGMVVMNMVVAMMDMVMDNRWVVNNKAERVLLRQTCSSSKQLLNADMFFNPLSTWLLPVYNRPQLRNEITLVEDVVGHVRKSFEPSWVRRWPNKLDSLGNSTSTRVVEIDVAEPKYVRNILNDQFQSVLRALANTLFEELLNRVAGLDLLSIFSLPPRRGAMPRFNKPLPEDYNIMFKHVFQVRELMVLELELDELSGRRSFEVGTRSELVGEPEFSVSHFRREKDERMKKGARGK